MAKLKEGSKGRAVRDAQTALNFHGAKPKLDVDGDFGPKTKAGVTQIQKAFAKYKTTKVNGQIDADMATSLLSKLPGIPLIKVWPLYDFLKISSDLLDYGRKIDLRKNALIARLEKLKKLGLGHYTLASVRIAVINSHYDKFMVIMRKKYAAIDPMVNAQVAFTTRTMSKKGQMALQKAMYLHPKLPRDLRDFPVKVEKPLQAIEREVKTLEAQK